MVDLTSMACLVHLRIWNLGFLKANVNKTPQYSNYKRSIKWRCPFYFVFSHLSSYVPFKLLSKHPNLYLSS